MRIALLGLGVEDDLQVVSALKNATVTAAALVFVAVAELDWTVVVLIPLGSVLGRQVGVRLGRQQPAPALRVVVVVALSDCSSPSDSSIGRALRRRRRTGASQRGKPSSAPARGALLVDLHGDGRRARATPSS